MKFDLLGKMGNI